MKKIIKSMDEFYQRYLPKYGLRAKETEKLKTVHVCPNCEGKNLHWIEHKNYGYYLCYGCGWSSMTPQEIGKAMAKETMNNIKLDTSI